MAETHRRDIARGIGDGDDRVGGAEIDTDGALGGGHDRKLDPGRL